MEWFFARKAVGAKANRSCLPVAGPHIYVSQIYIKSTDRHAISLRLNNATMEQLGWVVGDCVKASLKMEVPGEMSWTLQRVVGDPNANTLSSNRKDASSCNVRFSLDDQQRAGAFPCDIQGYYCELVEHQGPRAVFIGVCKAN